MQTYVRRPDFSRVCACSLEVTSCWDSAGMCGDLGMFFAVSGIQSPAVYVDFGACG